MHRLIGLIAILALLAPAALLAQHPEPPQIQTFTDAATLDRLQVDLDVRDGATIARYELQFSNHSSRFAEGRVILPVPPNSAVSELVLTGGPETLEGTVVPAEDARRIYQDIVRRLIDPALLQSIGADLYEVRAFPVPRGEQRQVSFTVTTPLLAEFDQVLVEIPWSRMSPRPASALVSGEINVSWDVRSAVAPTYSLDIERLDAGHLALGWEAPFGWRADTDFNLYLGGGEGLLDTQLLPYRVPGDDGFFALLLAPEIETDSQVARDIILVLDTSGSMEGEKIEQARDAARFVLERLGQNDRFGIVSYASAVRIFGEGLHPASEAAAGIDFVEGAARADRPTSPPPSASPSTWPRATAPRPSSSSPTACPLWASRTPTTSWTSRATPTPAAPSSSPSASASMSTPCCWTRCRVSSSAPATT